MIRLPCLEVTRAREADRAAARHRVVKPLRPEKTLSFAFGPCSEQLRFGRFQTTFSSRKVCRRPRLARPLSNGSSEQVGTGRWASPAWSPAQQGPVPTASTPHRPPPSARSAPARASIPHPQRSSCPRDLPPRRSSQTFPRCNGEFQSCQTWPNFSSISSVALPSLMKKLKGSEIMTYLCGGIPGPGTRTRETPWL